MEKRETYWVQRPQYDEEEEESIHDYEHLRFRLAGEWFAINSRDQLILPITPLSRLSDEMGLVQLDEDHSGLLAQFGGAELMIDMVSAGTEPTQGTEWFVEYDPRSGFGITHVGEWSAPFEWVETELDR